MKWTIGRASPYGLAYVPRRCRRVPDVNGPRGCDLRVEIERRSGVESGSRPPARRTLGHGIRQSRRKYRAVDAGGSAVGEWKRALLTVVVWCAALLFAGGVAVGLRVGGGAVYWLWQDHQEKRATLERAHRECPGISIRRSGEPHSSNSTVCLGPPGALDRLYGHHGADGLPGLGLPAGPVAEVARTVSRQKTARWRRGGAPEDRPSGPRRVSPVGRRTKERSPWGTPP